MLALNRSVISYVSVPKLFFDGMLICLALWLGLLLPKIANAQYLDPDHSSVRFFIDYPENCTATAEALPAKRVMTQKQLNAHEHWCTVHDTKNSLVEVQIFTNAFVLYPQHVSLVEADPDRFWKWLLERAVEDSLNALSQKKGAELISSSYRMQNPDQNPPGATACLSYEHDFQIVSLPYGARRSDNSGIRCVIYDSTSNVVANILLEYMENRPGAPERRDIDFDTEANKTFRSLQILGAKSESLN